MGLSHCALIEIRLGLYCNGKRIRCGSWKSYLWKMTSITKWAICGSWKNGKMSYLRRMKVWQNEISSEDGNYGQMSYLRNLESMTKWAICGSWRVWRNELSSDAEKYGKMRYLRKVGSMPIPTRNSFLHHGAFLSGTDYFSQRRKTSLLYEKLNFSTFLGIGSLY